MPNAVRIPSPESFGQWVISRREKLGYRTREDFIRFAEGQPQHRLPKNTIRSIERGERSTRQVEVLKALAGLLSSTYEEILQVVDDSFPTLDQIVAASTTIGKQLVEHIREYPTSASKSKVQHMYQMLMDGEFRSMGLTVQQFVNELNRKETIARFTNALSSPDMLIYVEEDFSRISFDIPNGPSLSVAKPELLWDCVCQASKKKGKNPECPIHSQDNAEVVTDIFRRGLIEIHWRDLRFLWRQEKDFWPPSVDSFRLLQNLANENVWKNARHVLDIGCGTGFLGIACASFSKGVKSVGLSDWLPTPLLYSSMNWRSNIPTTRKVSLKLHLGLHDVWPWENQSNRRKYDLVVCNPPYLPLSERFGKIGLESTVAGTDLLCRVLENAKHLGKRVFIQYSSLAEDDVAERCAHQNINLKSIGKEWRVPFRVRFALDHEQYMDWLISERGLEFDPESKYKYWHLVRTYEIR